MTKRAAFAKTITRLLGEDEHLILLLGDIGVYSFRDHPTRCSNIGISEQASVGVAAGLAMGGYYPIFSTIESFLLRRAYEFLRLDFGEQRLPGLFVGIGGAREYAKLGPTHLCPEGKVLVHHIPDMRFYSPEDDEDTAETLAGVIRRRELAYIRLEERV